MTNFVSYSDSNDSVTTLLFKCDVFVFLGFFGLQLTMSGINKAENLAWQCNKSLAECNRYFFCRCVIINSY